MISFSNDNGVTWKSPADFGLIVQPGRQNPLLPETVDRTLTIPGMNGEYDFGANLSKRDLSIPLVFYDSSTIVEMQVKARDFTSFLVDGKARPRILWLILDEDPDKYYICRYRGSLQIERQFELGFFHLPLVAHDPAKYLLQSSHDIDFDSDLLWDSDLTFDDKFTFQITGNQTVSVNNFGTMDVMPTINITGSFTTLSISANGKTLVYGESLSSQTLTIENSKYRAYVSNVNKNSKISGNWIELLTGLNSVTISGTGLNCSVSFDFKAKYL